MDKLQMYEEILNRIEQPLIPPNQYSVLEFGAILNSTEVQTEYFQKAIDTVSKKGGGRVTVPAGRFCTGALHLKSGVELHLESEDTILAFVNEDIECHYPVVFCHWEASPCYNFSPLIYACDVHDIAVTGKGILDGGADKDHWWNWHHQVENAWSSNKKDLQLEDRKALRKMNEDGIPVTERRFGPKHFLRPNFIQFIRCTRVLLQGITLKNSPMWQLNPVMCQSLTIDGVTLSSHGANNDGCDPESCSGVQIINCRFDTGDDCISLKSGRDRDGREAGMPCEYVLIENNEFADGHGGVALGSEMSGGIRYVLAWKNCFSSPNLTYALRLKTNAKRGGRVENIILADSVMDHVHGAAIHGTMLYEDGRNGNDLPIFRNITIENITAHGGDYGIFLEAFEEVPITGLILRNIVIDGAARTMRSMNWKEPVVEDVVINGQRFPRPGKVRILGIPEEGRQVRASAEFSGGHGDCCFIWEISRDGEYWKACGAGESFTVTEPCGFIRVTACDQDRNIERSRTYIILSQKMQEETINHEQRRLACRNMLEIDDKTADEMPITRKKLAQMLIPLTDFNLEAMKKSQMVSDTEYLHIVVDNGFLAKSKDGDYLPDGYLTRQEMATVAMQACGVNYRNASSTMPVCMDADKVSNNYGTNVARALYFGFMELDKNGFFGPMETVTMAEAVTILNRVADFAGI